MLLTVSWPIWPNFPIHVPTKKPWLLTMASIERPMHILLKLQLELELKRLLGRKSIFWNQLLVFSRKSSNSVANALEGALTTHQLHGVTNARGSWSTSHSQTQWLTDLTHTDLMLSSDTL